MQVRGLGSGAWGAWLIAGSVLAGCGRGGRPEVDSGWPPVVTPDAGEPDTGPPPAPDAGPPPPPDAAPDARPSDASFDGFVPRDAFCEGQGPVIRLTTGPDDEEVCTSTLARETFHSALCACSDATLGGALHTSSFSFLSPDTLDSGGASVGINGNLLAAGYVDVGGSLRLAGEGSLPLDAVAGFVNVWGDLEVHQHFELFGALTVAGDAYFGAGASYLPSWTGLIAGDAVTQTGTAEPSPIVAVGGDRRTADLNLLPPCDCEAGALLPVDALVEDARTHNDNANPDVMLDPSALSGLTGGTRVELPCGRFYLDEITGEGDVELVVNGRTALFVEGDVSLVGGFELDLGAQGELDLFISGNLTQVGVGAFGDPARPSAVRVYVGGAGDITYSDLQPFSANLYAPRSQLSSPGLMDVRGALFVDSLVVGGGLNIHYDREVKQPGSDDDCHDDYVPECSDACDPVCGSAACLDGACAPCQRDADCCGQQSCLSDGTCGVDVK